MNKDILKPFSDFLYILFPRRCLICGNVVALDEEICDECKNIKTLEMPICTYCGLEKSHCNCKHHKSEYDGIVAPFYYDTKIIQAVHNLKFNDFPFLAKGMAKFMSEYVENVYNDVSFDYVTYVPLSFFRQKSRGYNQAKLLADSVAENLNLPSVSTLKKIVNNKVQRKQNARQRRLNVYGAYDINCEMDITNKTVLLVDDVKTTGSTINECAKMLKMYGADKVYVVCCAVVNKNN